MSETVNETMNDVTMTDKLTNNDMASNVTGPASSGSEGRSANPSVAMPRVVSIVGPTASGKTGLGIAVARALAERGERAELVNADAYQMYRGMDIGTAKPTADEQAAVPHHLLDIIDPDEAMSVARSQQVACATIHDLQSRGIRPILVGGSGLYARAAIDDISFPGTDPDVRRRLEERERSEGAGALFDELRAKDPQAASRMDPHNPRRTIRALEVIEVTGRPYSASLPRYRYVIASVQIGLTCPARSWTSASTSAPSRCWRVVSSKRWSGSAPIWERPPGGRWAISKSSITWTGCAIWMTRSETSRRRPNGSPASRWDGSGVTRASIGSMRSIRDWWITRWPLSTMPTRAITTRSMRRRTSIRNIIWATCSNGRAARGDRYPVVTGNRVAAASVSGRAPAPSRRSGRPAWGSRGARCRRTSG